MSNRATDAEESYRDKAIWWSAAIVTVGAIGIGAYYRYVAERPLPTVKQEVHPAPPAAQAPEEPAIQNPIPGNVQNADTAPLPALNDSDQVVRDSLHGLFGPEPVEQFLVPENVIRHIVVTVDNLPRKKAAADLRPIRGTPGTTAVARQGDITTLSTDNYARYTPFVRFVQSADAKTLATVYFRLYPLFQQAYEDLGYPGKYFNDRLVETLDHLLDAPEPAGPIELVQPKVFYEYADPTLEERSAGQKLLIRMGPANERAIKAKLREFRHEVARKH